MPNVLTLETNRYAIKLENFEGPLDLLCHLIDKNKMDIYDVNLSEIGEVSDFDRREDTEMKAFIDKIKRDNQRLYRQTKFLMVLTKWDTLPNRINSETFLKKHRNQLYNEY